MDQPLELRCAFVVATECFCNLSPRPSSFLRTASAKQTPTCNHSDTQIATIAKSAGSAPARCTLARAMVCRLLTQRWRNIIFLLVDATVWQEDGDKRICRKCCDEVGEERSRLRQCAASGADVVAVRPQLNTDMNDMDIGDTNEELDALTYFEEEILAPVQPMVRVYTLYGTGLTEMRGHVASWMQSGPQFVRDIPARAHELNLLLVRRFPRDPNRKQRVPFIASPARLRAALDRIEGKLDSAEHVGLRYHRIVVNRENLVDYAEGQEPKGLQVQIVDQREDIVFDQSLSQRWMAFGTDAGNLFPGVRRCEHDIFETWFCYAANCFPYAANCFPLCDTYSLIRWTSSRSSRCGVELSRRAHKGIA